MTHPNHALSVATRTAASLSQRLHRLLVVVVTALFGMTLTSLSLAAPSPPHKGQPTTRPHAATPRPASHPSATVATPKSKTKPAVAQHPAQQRKTPTRVAAKSKTPTRVAAKSKTPTRAHHAGARGATAQPPRKQPSKLAAKQTKHTA